jgi:hypothetical protein
MHPECKKRVLRLRLQHGFVGMRKLEVKIILDSRLYGHCVLCTIPAAMQTPEHRNVAIPPTRTLGTLICRTTLRPRLRTDS